MRKLAALESLELLSDLLCLPKGGVKSLWSCTLRAGNSVRRLKDCTLPAGS